MHSLPHIRSLVVQGTLLIISGLGAYMIVGNKAFNMMLAGLLLGIALWGTAWYCNKNAKAIWVGFGLSFGGIIVFTQRTIANFLSLIGIIQHEMNFDAYNKSIMVVLYIMMSCTCICGLMLIYTYLPERKN
ncbi:MAG: hypothetical protein IPK10_03115 [Bacteroidetes bacterium]|nr:hypothetical protein [Bacteroidota bacterium]